MAYKASGASYASTLASIYYTFLATLATRGALAGDAVILVCTVIHD